MFTSRALYCTSLNYLNIIILTMTSLRNIDKLPATLPRETIACLKGFMGLRTHNEIQEWHDFCWNSPSKSVRDEHLNYQFSNKTLQSLRLDLHQQKINNPRLLPSLNAFLSKMDGTSWNLTPNHSNLVEGGHFGTNDITPIGKEIGKAVTRYLQSLLFFALTGI